MLTLFLKKIFFKVNSFCKTFFKKLRIDKPKRRVELILGSYSVSTNNLGDHIQIIAQLNLLKNLNLKPKIFIDRDYEVRSSKKIENLKNNRLFLIMNGWHRRQEDQWPPSKKILPSFIGFHIRTRVWRNATNPNSVNYFKIHSPIGCRDIYTCNLLKKEGIDCYVSNCLSLTFPKRTERINQNKIFISSRDEDLFQALPKSVIQDQNYVLINHYSDSYDFFKNLHKAEKLIETYKKEAKLVITSFLHCALPCLAMGIPVIVFYPKSAYKSEQYISDRERFSSLKKIIKCYNFDEIDIVDWNPKIVNVEKIRKEIISDFNNRLSLFVD